MNKTINTKQHALLLHKDNTKALHVNPKVNSKFTDLAKLICRSDELKNEKVCRDEKCDYLGIIID